VQDDPEQSALTFRTAFLGIGLSAFSSVSLPPASHFTILLTLVKVLGTIYTFKPQNATVSQLFGLIIAYVLGEGKYISSLFHPAQTYLVFVEPWLPSSRDVGCSVISIPDRSISSMSTLNRFPTVAYQDVFREHTAIVIMASTASNVAIGMEIIAALGMFYRRNAVVLGF
jgi:hypothetical protein